MYICMYISEKILKRLAKKNIKKTQAHENVEDKICACVWYNQNKYETCKIGQNCERNTNLQQQQR